MSRFQDDDLIRHRTGVNLFSVRPSNLPRGMYLLKPQGAEPGVYLQCACNYVDENFILVERRIQDEIQTEDMTHTLKLQQEVILRMASTPRSVVFSPRGMGKRSVMEKIAEFARGYGTDVYASAKIGRWVKAAPPFKIDRDAAVPEDVAVTLEGIPQGYYLKSFRVAGPDDLIIKTNGVVCKETKFPDKKLLLRPIVAKIQGGHPHVPGIPDGYGVVRVGCARTGDLYIDQIGRVAQCDSPMYDSHRAIVQKKVAVNPYANTLPGIPLGYKVVRFGDVSPEEFYFDTVGNLKQGPSKNRLVVVKREVPLAFSGHAEIPRTSVDWGVVDRKVRPDAADAAAYAFNQMQEVWCELTEVEMASPVYGGTLWTSESPLKFPGSNLTPTGRTRKVKVI